MERLPQEQLLLDALSAYPPKVRSLMLQVLTIADDEERAGSIGELYEDERTRSFADFLIDAEEDPAVRALVVGMLREMDRQTPPAT